MTPALRPRAGLVAVAIFGVSSAWAQGGPPFVTDDPGTPGDGNFEINIAAIESQRRNSWNLVGPDADMNYGWGEHIQLKLDMNWTTAHDAENGTEGGLGTTALGIKWRMLDGDQGGIAVATYPQVELRSLNDQHKGLLVPLEAAMSVGSFQFDTEIGRNFVQRDPDEWVMGLIVSHTCGIHLECAAEIHDTLVEGAHVTLFNLGFRRRLTRTLTLLGAAGRDFGTPTDERQKFLLFLGIQVVS
jgi:hypothetical protein